LNTLLLSTYELGHQPLALAWPLAALQRAGFPAQAVDLAVEPFPEDAARIAGLIAISVPMHTALRLGVQAARRARAINPAAHLCFYGLYAQLNADYLFDSGLADSVISGEIEDPLLELVQTLTGPALSGAEGGRAPRGLRGVSLAESRSPSSLTHWDFPIPKRDTLPALDQYAQLAINGGTRLAGYTEASRGCLHTCTHCPVVPIYKGRFFAVPVEIVLADVRQQVQAGARHITFGDPDFLNGPTHALRIARALHAEFPALTFDFTAKVEHLLAHRRLLPELVACGAIFAISAFESTSDAVLARLNKGHTLADMDTALEICAAALLPLQPTWVAFTPWTTLDDYLHMLTWIWERGLVLNVPPVQYAVRLLIPPGSLIIRDLSGFQNLTGLKLVPENFAWQWAHPDRCMDELHERVTRLVETERGCDRVETFDKIERLAGEMGGRAPLGVSHPPVNPAHPPRLTEDWFC